MVRSGLSPLSRSAHILRKLGIESVDTHWSEQMYPKTAMGMVDIIYPDLPQLKIGHSLEFKGSLRLSAAGLRSVRRILVVLTHE